MKYNNIEYTECDEVYPPAEDTFLLIDNLEVKEDDEVISSIEVLLNHLSIKKR